MGLALFAWSAGASTESDSYLQSLRPRGYVSDFAGVVSPADRQTLETLLGELDRKTGAEVAVVTVNSMRGGQEADFANRLYAQWRVGQKGTDRGAMLFAAVEDRRTRLEIGYGLEGLLTDARCGRVLDQYVIPAFKEGQYSRGLTLGALAVAQMIADEAGVRLEGVPSVDATGARPMSGMQILFLILLIVIFIRHPWLLVWMLSRGSGGGYRGGGYRGGGFGGGFGGFGGGLSGGGGASRGW